MKTGHESTTQNHMQNIAYWAHFYYKYYFGVGPKLFCSLIAFLMILCQVNLLIHFIYIFGGT